MKNPQKWHDQKNHVNNIKTVKNMEVAGEKMRNTENQDNDDSRMSKNPDRAQTLRKVQADKDLKLGAG